MSARAGDHQAGGAPRGKLESVPAPKFSRHAAEHRSAVAKFDPNVVSEALWAEWCGTIRQYPVSQETLGRLAPALEQLPTVIWNTPLSTYLGRTVGEIRRLRTHGEKRVRCVLEVFHSVYHRLKQVDPEDDLQGVLTPPWVLRLQHWAADCMARRAMPTADEVREGFVEPLMEMIEVDCGPTVYRLVRQRLGIDQPAQSVREQAKALGVTRARVYQLLDDCGKVMSVRWPSGQKHLNALMAHLTSLDNDHTPLRLFFALRELCFPDRHDLGERRPESDVSTATSSGLA